MNASSSLKSGKMHSRMISVICGIGPCNYQGHAKVFLVILPDSHIVNSILGLQVVKVFHLTVHVGQFYLTLEVHGHSAVLHSGKVEGVLGVS